jgi:CPA1 family monovalent cation:H+ antiporter
VADLEFLFLLLLGAAALVRGAAWLHVPYPIALVLVGLAAGAVPGLPEVVIDPHVVFLVFLPPLLASAGFYSSPRELRAELRPLTVLALGAVLATMGAVAVAAHELIDGLSWPAAFVLGAVVAPTDPVAAQATFSRMRVPERVGMLVEGEAMINDASALVAFRVALGAAVAGSFSVADAALDFVVSATAGVAIGLAAGWVEVHVLRKLDDRPLAILLSLLFPYAAYVLAEEAGVSGVLAAVVCGLYLGWFAHESFSADTRLSAASFWEVLVFGLNALLFLLLGLQFPAIVDDARAGGTFGTLLVTALALAAVVVAIRAVVVFLPFTGTGDGWRERVAITWSGMRGAVSLAAALSVPVAVAGRPEIVFVTVVVILVTLVGQGLTLPAVLRALKLRGDRPWTPDEAIARLETAQSALDRLDELEDEGAVGEEQLRRMRELYRARFRACQAVLGGGGQDGASDVRETRRRYSDLRRELIGVERAVLLDLRNDGRLRPDVQRLIQRDLDLEEARLSG